MKLKEFNKQHNHQYSAERYYIRPRQKEVQKSLERFQDAKFGIMFHWGLYSQWGIIESWALPDADRDWAWSEIDSDLSCAEFRRQYWDLIQSFNPVAFDPEQWAKTAKDAGFQYLLFTTKHHDGFCLWDTHYTDFKVTSPECPFSTNENADICKSLFDAFRSEGLKVHAYFSKPDWHSEYYWPKGYAKNEFMTRNTSYNTLLHPGLWRQFRTYTKNQLLELVTRYGRIECLWLDGGQVRPINGMNLHLSGIMKEARRIQPWLMVADRTVGGRNENFITPEQTVPDHPILVPWESCVTLGSSFSYRVQDTFKSAKKVIHLLCDIVAKGGNLALDIGPRPDGRLPEEVYPILSEVGRWLKKNGYAIYGTRPAAPYRNGNLAYTSKGDEVYAIYLPAEEDDANNLPTQLHIPFNRTVNRVLFNGREVPFTCGPKGISVSVTDAFERENAYVFTCR